MNKGIVCTIADPATMTQEERQRASDLVMDLDSKRVPFGAYVPKPLEIFLFGAAKIVAVKTGLTLNVMPDTKVQLTSKQVTHLKGRHFHTAEELRLWAKEEFLEQVKQKFIGSLRVDPELRRRIGGTKWEVRMVPDEYLPTVHTSQADILKYYRTMVGESLQQQETFEKVHHEKILYELEIEK